MIKQSQLLKLIFTLTIISVFQFFTSWTFTPKQLNEWIKNPDTNRCIKNKLCKAYLELAILREKYDAKIVKPTDKAYITKERKEYIENDRYNAKTPKHKEAVKLFSTVYTNMPSSYEPEDYDIIKNRIINNSL